MGNTNGDGIHGTDTGRRRWCPSAAPWTSRSRPATANASRGKAAVGLSPKEKKTILATRPSPWASTPRLLWYSDDARAADFDAAMARGEQVTSRFVELIVAVTQQLHAGGTIKGIFGRAIPS
jgi:hypothetical protein